MSRLFSLVVSILFALSAQAASASCEPTPHRTTGTHYKPVTEQRADIGSGVMIRGRILAAPDCIPVPNARIAHWQAGENGRYADRLRAYRFSDESGRYSFETEWPAMSAPHIHFIISADGYEVLETQWIGDERRADIHFNMVLRKRGHE